MRKDSKKKKRASPGSRKDIPLFCRLATLTEISILIMSQIRLIGGANPNRNNRVSHNYYPRFGAKTIQRQGFLNNLTMSPSILL